VAVAEVVDPGGKPASEITDRHRRRVRVGGSYEPDAHAAGGTQQVPGAEPVDLVAGAGSVPCGAMQVAGKPGSG
jgi:hypothetical protein